MTKLVHNERDFLLYGVWIATIGCLAVGLLFSVLSAIFAVLNTATNQYLLLTGLPGLYLWNALACEYYFYTGITLVLAEFCFYLDYRQTQSFSRWQMSQSNGLPVFLSKLIGYPVS